MHTFKPQRQRLDFALCSCKVGIGGSLKSLEILWSGLKEEGKAQKTWRAMHPRSLGYCLTDWSVVNAGLSGWLSIKGNFIFITHVKLRTFHYRSFASPTKLPWMKHLLSVTFDLAMDSQLNAWGKCSSIHQMVYRPLFKHISCFLGNINSARVRSQTTVIAKHQHWLWIKAWLKTICQILYYNPLSSSTLQRSSQLYPLSLELGVCSI